MPPSHAPAKREEVLRLLKRHHVLESLAERQENERRDLLAQMQRRENLVELERHLRGLHPADLASILASLSPDERLLVFRQLTSQNAALTLVELTDEVRAAIVAGLDRRELVTIVTTLDSDDLAYLAADLPEDVYREASEALLAHDAPFTLDTSLFPETAVGRLMRRDVACIRIDQTASEALTEMRSSTHVPEQTDRVFVIDARHLLRGTVLLPDLIRAASGAQIADIMLADVTSFTPEEPLERAAKAFERYDLVSAPVVDHVGKLIGRLTIDAMVDYLRVSSDQSALARAGLRGAEDLFAPVAVSVRNRWPWLALNLCTAFIASRVIGMFEETIMQLVALATLMPIVASIGGNTGNQTIALVIRAMALDQLGGTHMQLARKELTVAAVNGVAWGTFVGLMALVLYHSAPLAAVMSAAVFLNLLIAAIAGVAVPLGLGWAGRDPATGASVVLTFVTDSMGFFLILGLARLFLV
jgi:magnesium transporter